MTTDPRDQMWERFLTEVLLAYSIGLIAGNDWRKAMHPSIGYGGNNQQLNTLLWFEDCVPWQVTVTMTAGRPTTYWHAESAHFTTAYKRSLARLERRLKSINRHPTQKH